MSPLQPIQPNERIELLDIIRGIALLGILLVNMSIFSYPSIYLYLAQIQWWNDPVNNTVNWLITFLAEGKFYPMFSFLFGLGFMLFMLKAEQKGFNSSKLYRRRAFILLFIGVIHAVFIWMGDILVTYALLSLFLLLFKNRQPATILKWGIGLLIIPAVIFTLLFGLLGTAEDAAYTSEVTETFKQVSEGALHVYSSGTYSEILFFRLNELSFAYANSFISLPTILGMFLLGMYMIRIDFFQRQTELATQLKRIWLVSLAIGLPLSFAYATFPQFAALELGGILLGGPALTIFYLISFYFLYQKSSIRNILHVFAPVGRLGLTNYLTQSIVCTFIFYSYGLGLYGSLAPIWTFLLVIGIYILQIILSHIWLKRFTFGPVEWVWRKLTYR